MLFICKIAIHNYINKCMYLLQVERLLELHFKYLDKVRAVDDQIEREKSVSTALLGADFMLPAIDVSTTCLSDNLK